MWVFQKLEQVMKCSTFFKANHLESKACSCVRLQLMFGGVIQIVVKVSKARAGAPDSTPTTQMSRARFQNEWE